MFHLLYEGTYHRNKVTHWLLGKTLLLQKLKRNIGQDDQKVWDQRQALVPLIHGFSKKVMPHGFKKKDDISLAKEVIMDVRVPTSYGSSLRH